MSDYEGVSGEITVKDAIEKINSTVANTRSEGLEDLKHIFKNRRNPKLALLKDKEYHPLLERLFKILVSEKTSYLGAQAKPSKTRDKYATRLSRTANALRVLVEAAAPIIKKTTVKSVIYHVIDTLPCGDGEYCSPLSQEYLKALRAVLAHKPHAENLLSETWESVITFCINGIVRHYEDGREPGLSRTASFAGESNGSSKRPVPISQARSSSSRIGVHSKTTKNVEELLYCLLAVVSIPHAPLLEHAQEITSSVMHVIQAGQAPSLSISHQIALSILKLVLSSVMADDTVLCKSLVTEIVPVIARLWPTKLTSAKDEMLSILLTMHLHLESVLVKNRDGTLEEDIRYLSEILKLEYSERLGRDQLQLEDVEMATLERSTTTTAPLNLLRLRPHNLRAERNWMLLTALGILDRLGNLNEHTASVVATTEEEDEGAHYRKRRRITTHIDNLTETLRSVDASKRLTALQTLPFLLQVTQLPAKDLTELLECLSALVSAESGKLASWAILGLASCTNQTALHSSSFQFDWTQIWHVGGRMVTSSNHCRAACHLLHAILAKDLVKYHDIAEDVTAMITSPEITGPTMLADSTLSLMTHLLHVRNMEVPGASSVASQNVIRWAFTKLNPTDSVERNSSTNMTHLSQPIDFVNLLRACLSMPRLRLPMSRTTPCTPIGQSWHRILASETMIRYLLLLGDVNPAFELCPTCPGALELHELENCNDTNSQVQILRKTILELCLPKFEALALYWDTSATDVPKYVSIASVSATIFAFLVGSHVVSILGALDLRSLSEFKEHVESLGRIAISFTHGPGSECQKYDEALLQAIQPYLPCCKSLENGYMPSLDDSILRKFVVLYATEIEIRASTRGNSTDRFNEGDDDMMLMEEEFGERQRDFNFDPVDDLPREELSLATSAKAFNTSTSMHVVLIKTLATSQTEPNAVPPAFLDYLLSLPIVDTLLCRNLLEDLLQSKFILNDDEATRLLEHYAVILNKSAFQRCETVLGDCLMILMKTATMWASNAESAGHLMHKWFVKWSAKDHFFSSTTMIDIAKLQFQLIQLHLLSASSRSNLLKVLECGDIRVKFYIGARLSEVFGVQVLHEHEDILEEVVEKLPANLNWNEGIAFRMHVFALLASEWPTLIRHTVYHIYECPGRFPECSDHAARCFSQVSTALGLGSARELFRLFASQLLFTWFESDQIEHIPFRTLGYDTLIDLVWDMQADITALMMMRAQAEHLERVAKLLGQPLKKLIQQSFTKVMAYTTAYDTTTPAVENVPKGDVRIRKILGDREYMEYLNTHFADIVALLFCVIDQDERIDRLFTKSDELIAAGIAMKEMKDISSSQTRLPPNQQPAFNVRHLGSEIQFLCDRTKREPSQIYTPTMISFIARKLFDLAHPALGTLYTCAVLRKLRILVSIAGRAALQGYPLEMLLHSFRPYLTDPECVEDAIGVVQYLFVNGSAHLSKSPSFVSGIALSVLASLRVFLRSSRPSTTRDSQHKAIMSKVADFHQWLVDYLKHYNSPDLPQSSRKAFQNIIDAARSIRTAGNAELGTPESTLLTCLLEDERSKHPLMNRPSRDLAFSLLCRNFDQPASYEEDVFGSDDAASKYAASIWNLCRSTPVSKSFLAWGAKVIGRAFAASGHIHDELLRESEITRIKELSKPEEAHSRSSSSLLRILQALTLGNDHQEVGLAESTLRFVLSTLEILKDLEELQECQQCLPESIYQASSWGSFAIPPSDIYDSSIEPNDDPLSADALIRETWLEDLSVKLCVSVTSNAVLSSLPRILRKIKGFAEEAFPFILHLVLADQLEGKQPLKKELSAALRHWLNSEHTESRRNVKLLLNAILYLRTQPLLDETCHADRSKWLDIDYSDAAKAALRCSMYKTALLFAEISSDITEKSSRRVSVVKNLISPDLLLSIFRSIDDPDSFYGVQQDSSLSSVLSRLEYEKDGFKSLSFRAAQYDRNFRIKDPAASSDADSLVNTLGILRFDGLSHSLVSAKQTVGMSDESRESMFRTARKLEQWDIPVPETSTHDAGTIYRAFQVLNNAADHNTIMMAVDNGLSTSMKTLVGENLDAVRLHSSLQSLSILTEMNEILSSNCSVAFEKAFERFENRISWMKTGRFDDISHIISCRETVLSSLSRRAVLRDLLKIDVRDTRLVEIRATLLSSRISRAHGALQESLASTTYMTGLIQPCHEISLRIDGAVNLEAANSLWELGEMTSSIGLLRELARIPDLDRQTVPVSKSDLLAKLGFQVSTARLEMPDTIIANYLQPALAALKGRNLEKESGQVYHEFAVFCDQQLQDPDGLEDFERLRKLREGRQREVDDITRMMKSEPRKHAKPTKDWPKALDKAKKWYQLDNQEYTRLSESRAGFLQQSLGNYLLALTASDDHNRDTVRFLAMWLQNSDVQIVNEAVATHLSNVPTRKFAPLMNQLTSKLGDQDEIFQQLLSKLVTGICTDHPYHGMYQIWAATMYGAAKDGTAFGRKNAAIQIARELKAKAGTGTTYDAIDRTNKQYCHLAGDTGNRSQPRGKGFKSGQKCSLTDFTNGKNFVSVLTRTRIPPSTMHIEVAVNRDYTDLPVTNHVDPSMSIASGLSVPKIITLRASNGQKYKQLVKGGNDDLRQDAIMEQVFTQVSEILQTDSSTRQRNLQIRTYKIIPLTNMAGIIEFVPNSIPLGDFLPDAHSRYYPNDMPALKCRDAISNASGRSPAERLKAFKAVTEKHHPVMRYFFIERFDDPDEWFGKRLNYTRSTAANSMLGHVLGIGDRHQQNILLDEGTGEAVHIDFGFAFETGRVLPVPETVPFRLTRDVIDGMGITGTEGVFRRCCEFTLAALRKEIYSIMTVLDVLRYDPLYSWTISPARSARAQHEQAELTGGDSAGSAKLAKTEVEKDGKDDMDEADRALMVVRKKLSKTLSVEATVNDLINQATSERNLALLFHGWAAYA